MVRIARGGLLGIALAMVAGILGAGSSVADAASGPAWQMEALADTTATPGGTLDYHVQMKYEGGTSESTMPTILEVTLPAGLSAQAVVSDSTASGETEIFACTGPAGSQLAGSGVVRCEAHQSIGGKEVHFGLTLTVAVGPSSVGMLTSRFVLSGGGAPASTTTAAAVNVTSAPPVFALSGFDASVASGEAGAPSTQAGGHPFEVTTTFDLSREHSPLAGDGDMWPVTPTRDVIVNPPPGFTGVPAGIAQCPMSQMTHSFELSDTPQCSPASQVGTIYLHAFTSDFNGGPLQGRLGLVLIGPLPLFNLVPPAGEPVELGFQFLSSVVTIDVKLRPDHNYALSVDSRRISEAINFSGATVNIWGVPADPVHTPERWCPQTATVGCESGAPLDAFLRNPTSCTQPGEGLGWEVYTDAWDAPGAYDGNHEPLASDPNWMSEDFVTHESPRYPEPPSEWGPPVGTTGCEKVSFTPTVAVQPTSTVPASPSGLRVSLQIPQEAITDPNAVSQADLRKISVTLPEGVTVNPSAAGGLQACTPAEIGLHTENKVACPDASKIGNAKIVAPALTEPMEGSLYLASQNENPFGSLLATYLVAEGSGVMLKVAGKLEPDPETGRLTATFDNLPQQPVSSVDLDIAGGPRAPLVTPTACTPSSAKVLAEGWNGHAVPLVSPYSVECAPGLNGFAPSFTAGTLNSQAATFSPLTLTLSRRDGEQQLAGLALKMPPGVLGMLRGVARCPEPQAAQGACGEESLIGHVTAAAGVGPDPVYVGGGKVFLTGPYKGAPFGLSVAIPAKAGPLDLGTVVVRARIDVDPSTSQITISSDPFPTILQGIPLQIRTINVTIDRPGFTFNPTDCQALHLDGTIASTQGASANVSSAFQAANCAGLAFHPKFSASTSAKASRADGASLTVKLTPPAQGPHNGGYPQSEANIARVKVELPKQLPSRLTTLQKACTAAQFAANPAGCPAASVVGHATAHSPVLSSPLTGPAYFVSRGGEAFPQLIVVLQGEGVTVNLVGNTFISKTGITSSTFASVPDVPVSTFELTLPQGPYSALAANGNLCRKTLKMPTEFLAHNGTVVHQATPIAVEGCSEALAILSHSVRGRALSLSLSVPSAGKLRASGRGLRAVSRQANGRETLRLMIQTVKSGRFTTKVRLLFTPAKGRRTVRSLAVSFKR